MYLDENGMPEDMSTGGIGGGYTFDLDEINAVIDAWTRLLDDIAGDATFAQPLPLVQGPGDDSASSWMAKVATSSGTEFLDHNDWMRRAAEAYVTNLTKARDEYLASDAANAHRAGRR